MVWVPEATLSPEKQPEKVEETPPAAADTSATAPAKSPAPEKVYHTIRSGDTLSKIAKQHHTTVKRLCELNGITSTTILRVGKKLRVK